ncbi:Retrovirus-related Pol polyprotein from transposon RE2 [Bienertia sinuspersici]
MTEPLQCKNFIEFNVDFMKAATFLHGNRAPSNYLNWSRSIRMTLRAKNKLGFVDGKLKQPLPYSKEYSKWMRNDYIIRCWLFASVTPEIADQMILNKSAKDFWDELSERYGQSNPPQLYMIKKEVNGLL